MKTTNAQKPIPESRAVFVTCPPLAPSARAGSEKLAVATIRMITRPTQKNGEGAEELKTKPEVVAKRSRTMATGGPEQTTSGARPAPAASATRSQTLRTTLPKLDHIEDIVASCADGRYEAARSWRPIAPASYAIHWSAWKGNSQKLNFAFTEFYKGHLGEAERLSVRRVMSSSCSQLSPTKV
jgi:hypothetical protein